MQKSTKTEISSSTNRNTIEYVMLLNVHVNSSIWFGLKNKLDKLCCQNINVTLGSSIIYQFGLSKKLIFVFMVKIMCDCNVKVWELSYEGEPFRSSNYVQFASVLFA